MTAPLAALVVATARARRVRELLRLPEQERTSWALPALAIAVVGGLVALAAAQPVLAREKTAVTRTDVEAFIVVDISRSMLASSRGGATRFERARVAALRLREAVPDVPVGLASLTDRALPHLFPTNDVTAFSATLRRALDIERPPPFGFWTRATTFEPLSDLVSRNFFSRNRERRVLVVLTDGEARPVAAEALRYALAPSRGVRVVFVRFWSVDERVYGRSGRPEPEYAPDPRSRALLTALASGIGARVFEERELEAAERAVRAAVGTGPRVRRVQRIEPLALAQYAAAAALAPLFFLLWTRNRA